MLSLGTAGGEEALGMRVAGQREKYKLKSVAIQQNQKQNTRNVLVPVNGKPRSMASASDVDPKW